MPKKKLHKLKLDDNSDFLLIGIASHENDYRLSWALNQELGFKFIRKTDLVIYNSKHDIDIAYSRYFLENQPELNSYLISNKSEQGFLLPKYKNIDFILKISLDEGIEYVDNMLVNLKKIRIIITAFVLEDIPEKLEKIFDF